MRNRKHFSYTSIALVILLSLSKFYISGNFADLIFYIICTIMLVFILFIFLKFRKNDKLLDTPSSYKISSTKTLLLYNLDKLIMVAIIFWFVYTYYIDDKYVFTDYLFWGTLILLCLSLFKFKIINE